MKSMSLSTGQFGFAVSAYAFSAGISGLLTAGFADRFDRKNLLLFFYIGFIGGTLMCGLAQTYTMMIVARIVTGLFGGVIGSISMAIVADLFLPEQRGRVMGFMQMGFGASQVLGIPIGLFLANHFGWEAPFFMIVGLALIIWILILLRLQPVRQHLSAPQEHSPLRHLLRTLQRRDYRIGFLATALLSMGGFMMMPWGSAFAINNLKVTQDQLPVLFMAAGVSSLLIMPLIGRFADRIDKFQLFAMASGWMMLMVLIYTNLQPVPFWLVLVMNAGLMAGIMSRMVPAMALATSLPQLQDRGAFMSINSSLQQMAGGFAAAAGGMIVVQPSPASPLEHYNTLGLVVLALAGSCIWMIYRVSRLVKQRAVAAAAAPGGENALQPMIEA